MCHHNCSSRLLLTLRSLLKEKKIEEGWVGNVSLKINGMLILFDIALQTWASVFFFSFFFFSLLGFFNSWSLRALPWSLGRPPVELMVVISKTRSLVKLGSVESSLSFLWLIFKTWKSYSKQLNCYEDGKIT